MKKTLWLTLGILALIAAGCEESPSSNNNFDTVIDDGTTTGDESTTAIYKYSKLTNVGQSLDFGEIVYRDYIVRRAKVDAAGGFVSTNFIQLIVTNKQYVFVLEAISNQTDFYLTMGVKVPVNTVSLSAATPLAYQYSDGANPATPVDGQQGIEFPAYTSPSSAKTSLTYEGDDANNYIVNLVETPVSDKIYSDGSTGIIYNLNWDNYTPTGAFTTTTSSEFVRFVITESTDPTPFLNKDILATTETDATTTLRALVKSTSMSTSSRIVFIPNLSEADRIPGAPIHIQPPPDTSGSDFLMTMNGESGTIGQSAILEGAYIYTALTNNTTAFGGIVKREYVTKFAKVDATGSVTETNFLRLVVTNASHVFVLEALTNSLDFYVTMGMDTVAKLAANAADKPVPYQINGTGAGTTAAAATATYQGMQWPTTTSSTEAALSLTYIGDDSASYLVTLVETPISSDIYTDTGDGIIYDLDWANYTDAVLNATATVEVAQFEPATTSTDPSHILNKDIVKTAADVAVGTTQYGQVKSKAQSTSTRASFIPNLSTAGNVTGTPIIVKLKDGVTDPNALMERIRVTN